MRMSDWSSDVCSSDLPRRVQQRREAHISPVGHHLQPLRYKGAVQPLQRHHVGDRAQRDDIQQLKQIGLGHRPEPAARPQFPYDGRGQKKGDAHRRQMPVGRAVRRSEEQTSELQSLMRISYAVFCLKKKKESTMTRIYKHNEIKITATTRIY